MLFSRLTLSYISMSQQGKRTSQTRKWNKNHFQTRMSFNQVSYFSVFLFSFFFWEKKENNRKEKPTIEPEKQHTTSSVFLFSFSFKEKQRRLWDLFIKCPTDNSDEIEINKRVKVSLRDSEVWQSCNLCF